MPKNSITLHNEFKKKINSIKRTRRNFENAQNANIITDEDIIQAYAGLYLELFTEFEGLIEELFLGLITGSVTHKNNDVVRLIKITPSNKAIDILLSGKKYLDWLPYQHTLDRAKIYLTDGKPFSLLTSSNTNKLGNYQKIRHAIAHKSKKASDDFNNIISGLTLRTIERTPKGFLRNVPNPSVNNTQLEIACDDLLLFSHIICS